MSVVVVTGAGTGVGRATAVALAKRGWDVALIGHGRTVLEQTAEIVRQNGVDPLVCVLDVADAEAVEAAAAQVVERHGSIEAWVNSAAVAIFGALADMSSADLDRVLDVSCGGVIHGSRAAAAHMTKVQRGVIVNIGSSLAFTTVPLNVPYGVVKAAVRSFSLGLDLELRRHNVTVSVAHLPAIATPWFAKVKTLTPFHSKPVGYMHSPEVVGEAVADLVERPRHGDCYLGLSTVFVVAGARALPRFTAWFAYIFGNRLQKTKMPPPAASNLWASVEPPPATPASFNRTSHSPNWWPRLGRPFAKKPSSKLMSPAYRPVGRVEGDE